MEYEEMLEKARNNLPSSVLKEAERFEVPKVKGMIEGNKTIITNFYQIADYIHRSPEHLFKYILKELATPGELEAARVVLGRKVSAQAVNGKINDYVEEFVICSECRKPDTKLEKEGKVVFLRCLACGARQPVKSKV
jgi:translation initiation factor 2 subunit 2